MTRCLCILFLIWTFLQIPTVFAESDETSANPELGPFPVWNKTDAENLGPNSSIYFDPTTEITFEELVSNPNEYPFQPLNTPLANFGMIPDATWITFSIQNFHPDKTPYYLAIPYPLLDQIGLYIKRTNHTEYHLLGEIVPIAERPIRSVIPIQEIFLDGHEKVDIYLRIESKSSVVVPTMVFGKEPLLRYLEINNVLNGIIYGAAGGLIVYSLFIFIILREKVYLYYILSALCSTVLVVMVDGFSIYIPGFGTQLGEQPLMIFLLFSNFFALQLTRHFLGMVKTTWWVNRISLSLIFFQAILLLLVLATRGENQTVGHAILAVAFCNSVYMVVVSAYRAFQGFRPAVLFTLGWSMSILTVFMTVAATIGLIDNLFVALSGTKICFVVNMVFISIALANLINELKAAHFQKEQEAAKAQAANSAKGQFLAKMSHEIRTPLNGVIGMAQLVKDTELNDTQGQYVSTIISSGNALLTIISDILDYSKIESGKLEIENIEYDLYELLGEVADLFHIQAYNKNLRLLGHCDIEVPRKVKGDPTRIKQILSNYLSNAFKFTDQGKIEITTTLQQGDDNELFIKFCVRDSGVGIKKEHTERLFEDFSQADSSISRRYGGTGLGLAICKELSHLMGGSVGVESSEGEGSNFWFTVKLHLASESYKPWLTHPLTDSKWILIDDDHDSNQQITKELKEREIELTEFTSIHQAKATLAEKNQKQNKAQEVILVIAVNKLDDHSEENLRALKANLEESTSKIFLLSSFANNFKVPQHLQEVIDGVIVKPVYAFQVLVQIQRLLAKPKNSIQEINGFVNSPTTVLVADDNEVNLRIIEAMLKNWHIKVLTARDGTQVCHQYHSHHQEIDLILMDCEMPYMSGYEATEKIREFEREKHLAGAPIIALSAHVVREYIEKAMDSGMNDFVSKPIQKETLFNSLKKWLQVKKAG